MTIKVDDMNVNDELEVEGLLEAKSTSQDDNDVVNDNHKAKLSQDDHNVIRGLTSNDILAMEFESVEEVKKQYIKYAKIISFGIQKNNLCHNGKKEIVGRSWLCSYEGYQLSKHLNKINRKGCTNLSLDLNVWLNSMFFKTIRQ